MSSQLDNPSSPSIQERIQQFLRPATDEAGVESSETTYEAIGLSPKSGWLTTIAFNGMGGLLAVTMYLFTNEIPTSVAILGLIALASLPLAVLGLIYATDAWWGPHVRISFGLLLILAGGVLMNSAVVGAMVLLILFPLCAAAYLYRPLVSVPYLVLQAIIMPIVIGPDLPIAQTIVLTLVVMMLTTAAIFSQDQLRNITSITRGLSVTDPLTGIANLRRLRSRTHEALLAASRSLEPVTLFAIDLDDFKQVNDRFDHTRGDTLLKAVADELTTVLEPSDLLARRGGDEFAVMCPTLAGRDIEDLRVRMVDAVRVARLRECPEVNPEGSVAFVLSMPREDVDDLIQRADDALHEAKLDAHPERRVVAGEGLTDLDGFRRRNADTEPRPHTADHLANAGAPQSAEELRIARWAQRSLGTAMAWELAASMSLVIGTTLAMLSIGNYSPTLRGLVASLAIGTLLLLPLAFYWASRRELDTAWLRGGLVCVFGAMTVAFLEAGNARYELLELYLLPVMFAIFFLSWRRALPFVVGGLSLFSLMLVTTEYPYTVVRVACTVMIIVMTGVLLAKARSTTRDFTKNAVDMSVVDPLTGAANLRGLRQRVTDEIDRCSVAGKHLALMAIDLDDFKAVNDTYSHSRGDEVLVATARAIRKQVRADEMVARRGGDEFAAVCVFDDAGNPREVALRIADAIAEARIKLCPDTRASASIGYIMWLPGESCEAFLARADRELHGAKERSRAVHVA